MIEVYLDNSASTKLRKEVIDEMLIPMLETYGNPSSLHKKGVEAENLIKKEKERVARIINANPHEVIFTSGGTESNNIAIRGVVKANQNRGKHIITTKFEHSSVLNTFKDLEKDGFDVSYLDISNNGFIDLNQLEKILNDNTIFVSIMFVNSEVGTIQPIIEASKLIRKNAKNALFHVDAVQAFCKIDIDVNFLDIDLMSMSSHKIHGPKGVGALYVKKGCKLMSIITGGAQEDYLRPGTENVPGIAGFGKACEVEHRLMKQDIRKIENLRTGLEDRILEIIPQTVLNGDKDNRAPHICNISFLGVRGEVLLHALEAEGIYVSTGSACASHDHKISHVLESMNKSHEEMEGAIRFSLSSINTKEDIDYCIEKLVPIVTELRKFKRR